MSHKIQITTGGKEYTYFAGNTLLNISRDFQDSFPQRIILARVDGILKELSFTPEKDCSVEFITTGDKIGSQAYRRSCRMIMIKAFEDVIGRDRIKKISVLYSIGSGMFCELESEEELNQDLLNRVKKKMQEIVKQKIEFKRVTLPMRDALDVFREYGLTDKCDLFYYRRSTYVSYYMLDETIDYLYGYMAPDTSYADCFDLKLYADGFILELPEETDPHKLDKVSTPRRLFKVFRQSKEWSSLMDVRNIAQLNHVISNGRFSELVLVQEALMEKTIGDIAETIGKSGKRMILIAGPSSSGKTTFSHRLSIQLRALGLKPHPIPVDNYFVNREETPRDEFGVPDFECLEALDTKRFNEDIQGLLSGEKVELPIFNFVTGRREAKGNILQIGDNDVLVIEGIHSLNDKMTYLFDSSSKYKIYISALTQLSMDDHSRIPTTDVRLIRRMCRDAAHRGASARQTLSMWDSVRRGEDKNIFPYQEECDYMFNSALIYELSVLKQNVEPLLFKVTPDEAQYDEAKRLLKFLDYFLGADSTIIPNNSIIREFIGGSCFDVG